MRILALIISLSISITYITDAQKIEISIENSNELNEFAASIRNIKTFLNMEPAPISIRVFECGKAIGSLPEGQEVMLYNLYISVKEATEMKPIGELGYFWINGLFIDPRNYSFEPANRTLTFEHGAENSSTLTKFKISFSSIKQE